jgi:hypothetical protein
LHLDVATFESEGNRVVIFLANPAGHL